MTASDATELLQALRRGATTPRAEVEASLASLDTVGAELNVAVTTLHRRARRAAEESTRRYRDGTARVLEGLPVGLKDIIAMRGVRLTAGSRVLGDYRPGNDAEVTRRLREAGAVLVATLTTFAFANGDPVNRDYGVTRNPADPDRLAGGSSCGSAAAVGSGCVAVALGSDTGGSIRLPAAYCGVAGHKPTYGRVPLDGVVGLAWTLDHVGPLARSVRDLRLVLDVIGDSRRPSPHRPDPHSLRIGVPDSYFCDRTDAVTRDAFAAALELMAGAGARIVEVHIGELELMEPVGRTIITAEAASLHEPFAGRADRYDDLLGARLAAADEIRATDYLKAMRLRVLLERALGAAFAQCDVLATPTTPTVAPPIRTLEAQTDGGPVPWLQVAARNTFPFNISGMPTVSVPVPDTPLPVGLQLAGPLGEDEMVLAVAEWFESLAPA